MESKNFLKSLIAIKIVVASLSLALYQGWLTFGDLPSFAEDTNTKDRNAISSDDIAKKDAKKADMSADELESELGKKEAVPVDPKRKSFLADLFELPKLDPKSARKEEVGKYLDMADRRESQLKD
ncbi:MAG: hypothetical protein NT027_06570, partial [Proteobacteria bacterium]|nr:hypothetical protein [Pseudomonadota bacterium]